MAMSIFSRIFGTEQAIKSTIEVIKDAGDALIYTEEEKAQDRSKRLQQIDALLVQWMETTTGQNLARRLLAVMITVVWLMMYVISVVVNVISVWTDNQEDWTATAQIIGGYAQQMNGAMMLILAFYFSAPYMSQVVNGALDQFKGSKK
jgi:hypothetical protein